MLIKKYYYLLKEFAPVGYELSYPYNNATFKQFIEDIAELTTQTSLPISLNDSYVEKMWQQLIATYEHNYIFVISKCAGSYEPTEEEKFNAFVAWAKKLENRVVESYDYYHSLCAFYAAAHDNLMADVVATSSNKVKFNDTPQNLGEGDTYDTDDYNTHVTTTSGQSTSPMMTKIMRLKEIQDHYKSVMDDWVKYVGRVFLPESEDDYE